MRGGGCRPHRTRLSLHFWEMQEDFRKMQGGGTRSPAEIHEISIAWNGVSLLKRAGRSREIIFPQQGLGKRRLFARLFCACRTRSVLTGPFCKSEEEQMADGGRSRERY